LPPEYAERPGWRASRQRAPTTHEIRDRKEREIRPERSVEGRVRTIGRRSDRVGGPVVIVGFRGGYPADRHRDSQQSSSFAYGRLQSPTRRGKDVRHASCIASTSLPKDEEESLGRGVRVPRRPTMFRRMRLYRHVRDMVRKRSTKRYLDGWKRASVPGHRRPAERTPAKSIRVKHD